MPHAPLPSTRMSRAAIFALTLAWAWPANAQGYPPGAQPPQGGAQANPMCARLEMQLATIDRSGVDAARADQIRRFEDAATRQQAELDRVTEQAKKMGCDSSGFFSLFSGQSAQCGPINNQIQQMRGNLNQMTNSLERFRSGGGNAERDSQRRSVILALAQNNCGPQYANQARPSGPGGIIDRVFGNTSESPPPGQLGAPTDPGPPSGTYRTVCVRTCDGYYFPISFATIQSRFPDDEKTCKALCPAAEANLFSYRNPGEDINAAVSINGQPYTSSPNAFKYRQAFDPSCSCKAQGQTWSDALKTIDDKAAAEQGDIIVTEERAKRMAQPPPSKAAPAKKGAPAAAPASATPAPSAAAEQPLNPDGSRPIRSVGPQFIPAR